MWPKLLIMCLILHDWSHWPCSWNMILRDWFLHSPEISEAPIGLCDCSCPPTFIIFKIGANASFVIVNKDIGVSIFHRTHKNRYGRPQAHQYKCMMSTCRRNVCLVFWMRSTSFSLYIFGIQLENKSPQTYHIEWIFEPTIQFIFINFTETTESSVLKLQLVNYTQGIVHW